MKKAATGTPRNFKYRYILVVKLKFVEKLEQKINVVL